MLSTDATSALTTLSLQRTKNVSTGCSNAPYASRNAVCFYWLYMELISRSRRSEKQGGGSYMLAASANRKCPLENCICKRIIVNDIVVLYACVDGSNFVG